MKKNWAFIVTPKVPFKGITKTWSQSLKLISSSITKAPDSKTRII